ncbi:discoidin domain-containing protein [Actinopolymorpha singaporensis]|uniref:F5/8 type C domain-containing protein n=1 Tax=Actinopolymorpha singaporensis TaxID=117157 RepID=A0A1H1MC45_9ACTN|nr:discoidin domain-containing protein [Actinopolymorpha singaporensis]SDR83925.1 F5/8 type C domain-containing protein [Actinopolymorpha singaporensis]
MSRLARLVVAVVALALVVPLGGAARVRPAPGATTSTVTTSSAGTSAAGTAGSIDSALPSGSEDDLARTYYQLLLRNTRFQESTWNAEQGTYGIENWDVVGVLGNAVLLRFGSYDPSVAGVSQEVLRDHTIRSLAAAIAANRFVDPAHGTWGARIYWDATMEAYLVAAAHLMWADLDDRTRAGVDTILRGEAGYLVDVGAEPGDPGREGGTTNGLRGGYVGDTKLEEMGARTMMLAAADAFLPGNTDRLRWREWLNRWTLNMDGLPVADRVNPTVIEGRPVSEWAGAQNIFDTFTSENHGGWNGMYQQSAATYPGRNVVQYLIAGQPIPASQLTLPNNDEIQGVLDQLGTDAGVPAELMVGDRVHFYGRSLIPLTYRAMVTGDRMAARAERMLADRLGPYVEYPPTGMLVKFRRGTGYETEARAEVAMSYLLHFWRAHLAGDVAPVSEREYFARASKVTDFGDVPGLVNQQSPKALMSAVTKPGYVKFAYLPQHDDWLFDVSAKAPSFLPSVTAVDERNSRTYTRLRDGVDASATVVRRGDSYAGYTTLPDGSVVYATTGTGDDEGSLRLRNLDMPGVPGLDGDRTFTASSGSTTLAPDGLGGGGTEQLAFTPTQARYVRMTGVQAASQWGYSMYEFEVRGPSSETNLALNQPATASSSYGEASVPAKAVDGDPATRWANSAAERPTMKGWFAVDLGASRTVSRVTIQWQEDAWPISYRIEVSDDGQNWRTVTSVPRWQDVDGQWLNVDGRAGFVVRGSTNPIAVAPTGVALSHGPADGAAGMVVQGFPAQTPAQTARLAAAPQPSGGPAALRAALNDRYLSLFNLGSSAVDKVGLTVPESGDERTLYLGRQTTTPTGLTYQVGLAAGTAAVQAPRFRLSAVRSGGQAPDGLAAEVVDSHLVRLTNSAEIAAKVTLTSVATGEQAAVTVPHGQSREVRFESGVRTPTSDLARDRITYPSSPLPPGMSDPDRAVDADARTAWTPGGSDRRLVVNLGVNADVRRATVRWTPAAVPSYAVEVSTDGTTWTRVADASDGQQARSFAFSASARYVSVLVGDWHRGQAALADLSVTGSHP